jgi:hypothetical protein
MWLTSSSTPVTEAARAKTSTNRKRGCYVVNSLLLTLSAPVLSLSDLRQTGILNPGKDSATSQTKAI